MSIKQFLEGVFKASKQIRDNLEFFIERAGGVVESSEIFRGQDVIQITGVLLEGFRLTLDFERDLLILEEKGGVDVIKTEKIEGGTISDLERQVMALLEANVG